MAEFCYNSMMHLVTKMFPFELTLGKEAKKLMDLAIPMGRRATPRKLWRWSKGMKNYTFEPIIH